MSKKASYNGKKQRGGHTSLIPLAEKVVRMLDAQKTVLGIAPGFIDARVKSKSLRLKTKQLPIGLELTVYGNNSMQTILIYTKEYSAVEHFIQSIEV